jgi:hypothetical protein
LDCGGASRRFLRSNPRKLDNFAVPNEIRKRWLRHRSPKRFARNGSVTFIQHWILRYVCDDNAAP